MNTKSIVSGRIEPVTEFFYILCGSQFTYSFQKIHRRFGNRATNL